MASRRKSTIPCMVPPQDPIDSNQEAEDVMDVTEPGDGNDAAALYSEPPALPEEPAEDDDGRRDAGPDPYLDSNAAEGGYECKYCSFQTSELNLFTMHVDTEHPDVVINASYVCVECDYHTKSYDTLQAHNARLHPGEDNFTRTMVKRNNETVFEQTVNDLTFDGSFVKVEDDEAEDTSRKAIPLSKTPIMRIKSRPEPKKFAPAHKLSVDDVIKVESDDEYDEGQEPPALSPAPTAPAASTQRLIPVCAPLQVQAIPQSIMVNSSNMLQIKGGSSGGGAVLPPGTLAQVLSALQTQQSPQTQLLIPISSIPTYNSAMDNNVLLVSAYNRFPYPSVSEIIGLSAQTKFSEEQIKVWFSAQRLKHGVSWTPEEVEEARRKKFNGTVQTVPQTITVIPANIGAATNGLQSIFQTCQIVGQPGLVLTQVAGGGSAVPVASPITLTVAGVPGNQPKADEASAPDSNAEVSASSASASLSLDAAAAKPKKSKEQLAELKASYGRRQFATEEEISRLMEVTKLSKRAIKKWFSDTRYNQRNSRDHHSSLLSESSSGRAAFPGAGRAGRSSSASFPENISGESLSELTAASTALTAATIVIDSSDDASDSSPTAASAPSSSGLPSDPRVKFRHAFPDFTPQKFKEKTTEQLHFLEASFQKADMPSDEELSRLRAQTKLTRREVDAWFTERRKTPSAALKDSDGEMEDKVKAAAAPVACLEGQTTPHVGRKILKKTPEQLHILKKAFVRSQWPTSEEYDQMSEETGLPRTYIVNWFGDTRYSCKNSNLKWYYLYQSGKVDEALNGGGKSQKKPRKRSRGWTRRTRRPHPSKRSPQGAAGVIKVKSGKAFLKDYYLKHKALSERDLDDLVTKSKMSYEQVRDWFSETAGRVEEGKEPFSNDEAEEDEGEEEDEVTTAECRDSEGDMEAEEQGEAASSDDYIREEKDPGEEEEEEEEEEDSEGLSHSQPQTEEQT